ncbi:lysoplasmalogenase family protein [Pelagerythrobacter marensis]|uniref:YhhN-like protein n=1 Tax=Pelagerythrobacter marensis TaxID=543877 RepID=A0A0G3X8X3_9SPHN|nr:lysoplasmalogenase family protein [Pelagerythrobacter marensis]AKM07051.1 YhhN-like protein [Pelagerythrobacter marensis]
MSRRALVEHRPWLFAAIAAATIYYFVRDWQIGELWLILLKGAGCIFLAGYALARHDGLDARLLALVMATAALGDMLIELDFTWGGAAFFASHLAAMSLYLRNPRPQAKPSQKALAVALLFITPLVSWLVSGNSSIALYAITLGGMAACAWMSRFPRYRVGVGAVLFIVSDWLIFARFGPLAESDLPQILIWPTYFAGQILIATGVIQTLRTKG